MASLVLVNGKIVTVDNQFSVTQAVAVDGERITAAGTDAAIRAHAGPRAEMAELDIAADGHPAFIQAQYEALVAHTRSNARLMFRENYLGSIAPGLLADMVVLDRDFLTVPADEIRDITPVATIVAGKVVHGALP